MKSSTVYDFSDLKHNICQTESNGSIQASAAVAQARINRGIDIDKQFMNSVNSTDCNNRQR